MDFDLFHAVGGGQSFYRAWIARNPEIAFFYLARDLEAEQRASGRPRNATPIAFDAREDWLQRVTPEAAFSGPFELVYFFLARRIARSLRGHAFDVVDVPSFQPCLPFLRGALAAQGVRAEKLVLSLHGWNSTSVREDWVPAHDEAQLRDLEAQEAASLASADVRCGISRMHLRECESLCALPTTWIDPHAILDAPAPSAPPPAGAPPDLWFVGRIEKLKGPDLFLELVSRLPRARYGNAFLAGPDGRAADRPWSAHVAAASTRLGVESRYVGALSHAELVARVFEGRCIAVFPSRADSFNLAVIEALFRGCPAVVSTRMGVFDFLRSAHPTLPFVALDPQDLAPAARALEALLRDYDAERARLGAALRAEPPHPPPPDFARRVYDAPPQADPAALSAALARHAALATPPRWARARWAWIRLRGA